MYKVNEELFTGIMGQRTLSLKGEEDLFEFLTGVPDENYNIAYQPELDADQALVVIYYMERKLAVNPSAFTPFDDADDLYQWLQNQHYDPEAPYFLTKKQPGLSADEAFAVIQILQRKFGMIANTYEQCSYCKHLFDSAKEGTEDAQGDPICDDCSELIR